MAQLNPNNITDHDIRLAEQWRMWAIEIEAAALFEGANSWAARALHHASSNLSEAAMMQDKGEGIKRRPDYPDVLSGPLSRMAHPPDAAPPVGLEKD